MLEMVTVLSVWPPNIVTGLGTNGLTARPPGLRCDHKWPYNCTMQYIFFLSAKISGVYLGQFWDMQNLSVIPCESRVTTHAQSQCAITPGSGWWTKNRVRIVSVLSQRTNTIASCSFSVVKPCLNTVTSGWYLIASPLGGRLSGNTSCYWIFSELEKPELSTAMMLSWLGVGRTQH